MKNIFKTVGLLTIISVIPGAFAATSRVGVYSPNLRSSGLRLASYVAARTSSTTENTDKIFFLLKRKKVKERQNQERSKKQQSVPAVRCTPAVAIKTTKTNKTTTNHKGKIGGIK